MGGKATGGGLDGFNEAGAVMPRKGWRPQRPPPALGGFNEAGAVMPRKGERGQPAERLGQVASMRPGLLCPGRVRVDNNTIFDRSELQ